MSKTRFRQIHLDFHTSGDIENVGMGFDPLEFQQTLLAAEVNSITLFATCHHGWSYYKTEVGQIHPHLTFDLLQAQYRAAEEVNINVQIYLTGGVNNQIWEKHPAWREIYADGSFPRIKDIFSPGFRKLCLNSLYLDLLCKQIVEVATMFPESNGLFIDIINQGPCCCNKCLSDMLEEKLEPDNESDRLKFAERTLERYYKKTFTSLRSVSSQMNLFHNSGHIERGKRDNLKYFTHLELESLPTGGWGYDHFPLSAKYSQNLGLEYSGMTGKFHTTWGEMGGFKHPNALRYECCSMLAYGARCCIGDHPGPDAVLDRSTYENIGKAYREVKDKERWCTEAKQIADIAILSAESFGVGNIGRENAPDTGAVRFLLEEHFLFDVIDREVDFNRYKLLILPDCIPVDATLRAQLGNYLDGGGRVLLSGNSGKNENGKLVFDIGAEYLGQSEFELDYILPREQFRPDFVSAPLVTYRQSHRIRVTDGLSMGDVFDPYFNRTGKHFSGHQHAPARSTASGFDCGVIRNNIMYLAHPFFSIYYQLGAVACRQYLAKSLRFMLKERETVTSNLPSTARLTLAKQMKEKRYILHLLYANTIKRGANLSLSGGTITRNTEIEVIEELLPLRDIQLELRIPEDIKRCVLEPQDKEICFSNCEGIYSIKLKSFTCHQMIALHWR